MRGFRQWSERSPPSFAGIPATDLGLSGRGDHDFSSSVPLVEIADCLRSLAQRVRPVDDRRDLARLDELPESCQIPFVWSRRVIRFPGVTSDSLAYEP